MATKKELFAEAKASGLVPDGASADDYEAKALEVLLGRGPAWEGSMSSDVPLVGADGHQNLTQEDIDSRA